MAEGIKIPVNPEVNFDPNIFAKFEAAAQRAANNATTATNRVSKSYQTLGLNIQTTGILAAKTAAAVAQAQAAMTNTTVQQTATRINAIRQQMQAVKDLTNATRDLADANRSAGRIGTSNSGGGGSETPKPNRVAELLKGSQLNSAFKQGTSNVLGITREVGRGMGFDLDISNSMQRNMNVNREATQLAIQGESGDVKGTAAQIEAQARQLALETGANVEDIIKGLRSFQGYTGDLKGGMDQLRNMTQSSVAFDTPLQDIASLYAVITKYMGKDGTKEGVDALVRSLGKQGRIGAVELRDQIKQDPKILVNAANFAVTDSTLKAFGGDKKAAQAGVALGLQQALMGVSAESAQQTGNAVKSFTDTLTQKNAQEGFKKHGIDIFTKDKETGKKVMRPLEELIPIAVATAMKDPNIMRELMPNVRGRKAIQGLSNDARVAYDESLKSGSTEQQAELAAATVALNQLRQAATQFQSDTERMKDVNNFMSSEAGKAAQLQASIRESMDQATKKIAQTVSEHTPEIKTAIEGMAKGIEIAAEHPKLALAGAFAAPILQQITANALATAIPQAFAAFTPALLAAAPAIATGAGAVLVGAAIAASIAGILLSLQNKDPEDEGEKGTEGSGNEAGVEERAERRDKTRETEDAWSKRFEKAPIPESEGYTGNNPDNQPNTSTDFNYEKFKQGMDEVLRNRPLKVEFDMIPSGNRMDGVSVE